VCQVASTDATNSVPEWAHREAERALAEHGYQSGSVLTVLARAGDRLERNLLDGRQPFDDGPSRAARVEFVMMTQRVSRRTAYRRTGPAYELRAIVRVLARMIAEHRERVEAQLMAAGRSRAASRVWIKRHRLEPASSAPPARTRRQ
jgi:hypothetical protein